MTGLDIEAGTGPARPPTTSPLDIALALAAAGIPSFPCVANKRPAIPEHEGGHGHLDATADPAALRALFARAPKAKLVGVPTGSRSGVDILDVDPRHDGDLWEVQHTEQLPNTRIHQTGGGGRHWVFQHVEGVTNRAGCPARGVDIRGEGGYAIWPPSAGYSVVNDTPVAPWPTWLLELVRKPAPVARPAMVATDPSEITDKRLNGLVRALLARISHAPEGLKHDTLLRIARALGGYQHMLGYTEAELVGMLLAALPTTVLDCKSAEKTALDGLRHGMLSPLTLEERPNPNPRGNGAAKPEPAAVRRSRIVAKRHYRVRSTQRGRRQATKTPDLPPRRHGSSEPPEDPGEPEPAPEPDRPAEAAEQYGPPTLAEFIADPAELLAPLDGIIFGQIVKPMADLLGVTPTVLTKLVNKHQAATKARPPPP